MGTKVSKKQGDKASQKVAAVTAFSTAGKTAQMRKFAIKAKVAAAKPTNLKKVDLNLSPSSPPTATTADVACHEGFSSGGMPVQIWMKTGFNINAKHGGGTALVLISRNKSDNDGSELQMIRCGVDGNHMQSTSVVKGGTHSIYEWNEVHTTSEGYLCPVSVFGKAHCAVFSNIARMGHCGCAVVFEGSKAKGFSSTGIMKPGLKAVCDPGGGALVVICSAPPKSGACPGNIYHVHQGNSEKQLSAKPLCADGDDQWQFTSSGGQIEVTGPSESHYAILYSFSERFNRQQSGKPKGKVYHTQAFNGTTPTRLLNNCSAHVGRSLLLMCSCSSGSEDATTSAVYQITLQNWKSGVHCTYIAGSSGHLESPSVWTVSMTDNELSVVGPALPCRYAFISNIPEDVQNLSERCDQASCLATGIDTPLHGAVEMRGKTLLGWVSNAIPVRIMMNETIIETIAVAQLLEQPDGRIGFQRELTDEENGPGLKLFKVYGLVDDVYNKPVPVELEGSPFEVQRQPPGVLYALNLGGPTYEASNKIVYADTQSIFKVHPEGGYQCSIKYGEYMSRGSNLYSMVSNTYDGFLYTTYHTTHPQFFDEYSYNLPVPSSSEYKLEVQSIDTAGVRGSRFAVSGQNCGKDLGEMFAKTSDVIPGFTAKKATVPCFVENGYVNINIRNGSGGHGDVVGNTGHVRLNALVIYDPAKYKEPQLTQEEVQSETVEKQKLSDTLIALDRTFSPKEMKIAGWSSYLLENASGEAGNLSHWNSSGNWKTSGGGDQTETMFVSSYMACTKYQEIDLTQHFSEKHLDSCPEIQASESFHEGCNQGGFYTLTVSLMTYDGEVITRKTTGEKGSIKTRAWIKESFEFKAYKKGVRIIGFETSARDDKFWAGHFGAYASAAMVRVKSEVAASDQDQDGDVVEAKLSQEKMQELSKMLGSLNEEYKEGLKELKETMVEKDAPAPAPAQATSKETTAGGAANAQETPVTKTGKRKKREIRIFVSSTFVDFVEEREILIKKAFREVNRLCLDRGVFFTYVDLRWGITTEQTDSGETISICLREVERCRPYFICLLGDRFGWSQTKKKKDKLLNKSYSYAIENFKQFEWLDEYRFDTSVTKLEVLHAVLRENQDKDRTFFYLRESRVERDQLPPPGPEHVEGGEEEKEDEEEGKEEEEEEEDKKAEPAKDAKKKEEPKKGETQWHFDQQHKLRETVKNSGITVREFKTAEDGCLMIKEDLTRCVNEDFPPGSKLTPLQREKEAHIAFADARKRVYIGREEYFTAIDNHFEKAAKGDNQPLVIVGESGSGKSALVANWCGRFETKNPNDFLFMHFIGSSAESASHWNLLRRLYEEIRVYLQQDLVVPSSDRNLILELPAWLKLASNKGQRVMLVLDALNQLDSGAGSSGEEQDLKWLPKEFPPNVHLLVSTLPGKAKDAVEEAGWPVMEVFPLDPSEKLNIITSYMAMYAKTLTDEQKALIIEAKQSSNPLYLKALLDEVRMYGSFHQLTKAIQSYLTADDPGKLFVKILERLEADFDNGEFSRPGLVRETTQAIWCSHRGMSEQELLNFLRIPSRVWSPFYLSLEENLVNRNGILNFFHDHLRQAVERKYLPTAEDKCKGYLALADFFNAEDIDDRYVDEVPFLLAQAGEMKRLRATVLNIEVFQRLTSTEDGKYQLIKSWQLLGGYEQVEDAYLGVLTRSEQWEKTRDKAGLVRAMAGFFMQLGLLKGARLLFEQLLKELELRFSETHRVMVRHHGNNSYKFKCNYPDVIDVLTEMGTVCRKLGQLKDAYKSFHDALTRLPSVKMPAQKLRLVKALMGMGSVMRLQGNADMAKRFLMRAQEVATEVLGSSHHYVAAIIGQIGELSYSQGKLEEAILHHLWDLRLTQADVGLNHPRVAAILNNIALVLDDLNNGMAGEIFQAVLAILVEAYGNEHVDVAIVRYNLGAFFLATNLYQRVGFQFREALRIFKGFLGDEHYHTKAAIKGLAKLKEFTDQV